VYKPLDIKAQANASYQQSMMPRGGLNKEDLAQMMDTAYALKITNYIPYRYGLEKRKGITNIFERAGANPITLLKEFTDGVWIIGYSTKVEAYNTTTDTWTTIKDDFTAGTFDGARYGEYFFVCNGVEKIHRIDNTLAITEVSASPICGGLKVIGPRLYAYRLSTDETAIRYSEVDTGANPPFNAWTETTAADTGGTVNYRNAGPVRSVVQLGELTVVFSDKGFYAFLINTIDSAGTMKKVEVIQNYTEDYGGARGAIGTPMGVFYVNEAGLWQMVSVGNTDTPMSRQQILTSSLLGGKYFENINQESTDLIHDVNQNCVFVTCAKDSPTNNLVIGYKLDLKAFFEFQNWNINRFAKSGDTLYGASSVKTTVYQLFDGYDDDGLNIGTDYQQEIPLKTLFHAHRLNGLYTGGFLSSSSELTIRFDIYDVDGVLVEDKAKYKWTATTSSLGYDEFGSAAFGDSMFGGDFDTVGLVESFGGGSPRINNLQRLRVRITAGDKLKHILNWIVVKTVRKTPIRRRNISQIT
jgi:hypothetical protein